MSSKKPLTPKEQADIEKVLDPVGIKKPAEQIDKALKGFLTKAGLMNYTDATAERFAPEQERGSRRVTVGDDSGSANEYRPAIISGSTDMEYDISDKKVNMDSKRPPRQFIQKMSSASGPLKPLAPQQKSQDQLDFEEMQQNAKIFEASDKKPEPVHFGDPKELMKGGKFDAQGIRALINGGQLKEENIPSLVKDGFLDQSEAAKLQLKQKALQRFLKQGK